MLNKLSIVNYRSCISTQFDCHKNLSVLIGPNSSGKTNVLQAILFLNKLTGPDEYGRFPDTPATINSVLRARFHDGKNIASLTAKIEGYTDESNNDVLTAARQRWLVTTSDNRKARFEMPILAGIDFKDVRLSRYHLQPAGLRRYWARTISRKRSIPAWAMTTVEHVARFCLGIRYYSASQFTNPGSCPVSFEIQKEGDRSRPVRLRGHERMLYHIYQSYKNADQEPYNHFMDIVGRKGLRLIDNIRFREVTTSSVEYSVRVGGALVARRRQKVLIIPRFRQGRQELSPNQLSEGTFKTLALLFYIVTERSTALLIEEPEVCVHHGLLSSILELISIYSHEKQMIVSTHSDYVLDHVQPENVFRVSRDRLRGTRVSPIRKTMTQKEYSALRHYLDHEGNLGEFWREGGLEDRP